MTRRSCAAPLLAVALSCVCVAVDARRCVCASRRPAACAALNRRCRDVYRPLSLRAGTGPWRDYACSNTAKRRQRSSQTDSWHGVYWMVGLLAAIVVPLLVGCLWSVVVDPVTPHIAKELWYRFRDMCFGR
jgi:hypothetical protein